MSSLSSKGIPNLRRILAQEISRLPQMGWRVNPNWIQARDEVLQMSQPHISWSQFHQVCKRHQLDRQAALTWVNLLHDLGLLIHYSDDSGLHDLIILKPEWIVKAIGLLLEDKPTAENAGVLEHTRLHEVWHDHGLDNEPKYEQRWYPYFLRLMEKFDVCYRIVDEYKSVVGQMVPFAPPSCPSPKSSDRRLSLIYEMECEPTGIIPWLIVRNHRHWLDQRHWRRGLVLGHYHH